MRRAPTLFWIAMALLGAGLVTLVVNHDAGATFGLSNERFGSLVYLGAILVIVAGGVVLRRGQFGSGARHLAIWIAIFLLLMIGYLYRYELQDVGSRLSAGLIPGSPLSLTDAQGRVTVQIERAPNGHFEVDAEVEGRSVRMVVDTGATLTVLTERTASLIGIDTSTLVYQVPVSTANGMTMAARARIETLSVGAIERRSLPVLVAQEGTLDQNLLGMNFIGTLSGFDMRGDRLILHE